ncbi:hypothetical protein [Turneriella parva]|nr:hypothetical protein [Turneriella parva]
MPRLSFRRLQLQFVMALLHLPGALMADELLERARTQAVDMTHAFQREDAKALVRYTAEPIVKRKGGAEALEKLLIAEFAEMKKDKAKLLSFEFIRPDRIHTAHGQLFVLIERKSRWQYGEQTMDLRYNLMGVSADSGETWRFLEVTSLDENLFKHLFGFVDQTLLSEIYQYTSERSKCLGGKLPGR